MFQASGQTPYGAPGRMRPRRYQATAQSVCAIDLYPSSRELRRSTANRVHHPIVDAAPTELILQGVLDFFLAGIWIAVQQNLCGHDHAVGAVTALSGLLIDERSLQRMRLLDGRQSLERGDRI